MSEGGNEGCGGLRTRPSCPSKEGSAGVGHSRTRLSSGVGSRREGEREIEAGRWMKLAGGGQGSIQFVTSRIVRNPSRSNTGDEGYSAWFTPRQRAAVNLRSEQGIHHTECWRPETKTAWSADSL